MAEEDQFTLTDERFNQEDEDVLERLFTVLDALYPDPNFRPDVREGSLVWTLFMSFVKEVVNFYVDMNIYLNQAFIQYATGTYLDLHGVELGVPRIEAQPSEGVLRFLGENGTVIPTGTAGSTEIIDTDDPSYQFETNIYSSDGVTPYPVAQRTIVETTDPLPLNDTQTIANEGPNFSTGGTFTLDFDGQLTNPLDWDSTAAQLRVELEALSNIGVGNVEVTGGPWPSVPLTVVFQNDLGSADQVELVVDTNNLTGPGTNDIIITTTQEGTNAEPIVAAVAPSGLGINGTAMYRYTWVTVIGDPKESAYEGSSYGETGPSPETDPLLLANQDVQVTLPAVPPLLGLNKIKKVRVYRSFNDGTGFSEYRLVGEVDADETSSVTFIDNVENIDFEVIDRTLNETNQTGVVDIFATATTSGVGTNVGSREVTLLDDFVSGVEKITNPYSFSGGQDTEDDEDYRSRLLDDIRKPPGAGTVSDYKGWAESIAGVGGATVVPEWENQFGYPNGPGTVKVIISGPSNEVVNYDLIEEVRQYIAGDIALASPRDFFGTLTADYGITATEQLGAGDIAIGDYEYVFTFVNVGGGETPHSGVDSTFTEDDGLIVSISVTAANSAVELTDLPVPGPSGVGVKNTEKRRIYRRNSASTDENFYLVGEITDNSTDFFTDTLNDSDVYPSGSFVNRYAPVVNSTSLFNGVAPIGAHVTVETITSFNIAVNATIVPEAGYNLAGTGGNVNLTDKIAASLSAYFASLEPGATVYFVNVQNAIHDTDGVRDFRDVELVTPTGVVTTNIAPPSPTSKAVFNPAGILTEAAV